MSHRISGTVLHINPTSCNHIYMCHGDRCVCMAKFMDLIYIKKHRLKKIGVSTIYTSSHNHASQSWVPAIVATFQT